MRALSEVSGPGAEAYFEAMRTASAELLRGIGHYFIAMAVVEEVDILRPNDDVLRASAADVREALAHIQGSIDSTSRMVEILPEAFPEPLARFMTPRVELNITSIGKLLAAASSIVNDLEAGSYPRMANCEAMNRGLEEVIWTFITHSQLNGSEGF